MNIIFSSLPFTRESNKPQLVSANGASVVVSMDFDGKPGEPIPDLNYSNEKLERIVEMHLKQQPDNPEALGMRFELNLCNGKIAEAGEDINKLVESDSKAIAAMGKTKWTPELGKRLVERRCHIEHRALTKAMLHKFTEAQSDFEEALKADGDNFDLRHLYAGCLLKQHKYKEAADSAEMIINSLPISNPLHIKALEIRAIAYMQRGLLESAIEDFNLILSINQNHSKALKGVSKILTLQGNRIKSALLFDKAVAIGDARTIMDNIKYCTKAGEFDKALSLLNPFIKENKTDFKAYFLRGKVHLHLCLEAKALKDFNKALVLLEDCPSHPYYVNALVARGKLHMRKQNYEKAMEDFTSVLKVRPQRIYCLLQRAYYYKAIGKSEESFADFSQILYASPNHPRALYEIALHHSKNGEQMIGKLNSKNEKTT